MRARVPSGAGSGTVAATSAHGASASGLQMLPMMGGMLATSIVSGQLISRTGRYKLFPVLGTGVMTAGLLALSRRCSPTATCSGGTSRTSSNATVGYRRLSTGACHQITLPA